MTRVLRLLGYVQPYWLQAFSSVILMAMVGLLDAFRLLLVGPIFDRVLNPNAPDRTIPLLGPRFGISLQQIVPSHFHNAWDIVAEISWLTTTCARPESRSTMSKR